MKNALIVCVGLVMLGGCRIEHHGAGGDENVKIDVPFGGINVKANDATALEGIGLTAYPGATMVKNDKDNGSADVNLSFGNFHLGVKATSFHTTDAPAKVLAFYKKDMARYGAVIFCKDGHAVGAPERTQDGLGCKEDGNSVHGDASGRAGELKAGSKQRQHIVAVDDDGSGTKFGLVALELPGHLGDDDDKKD